MVCIFYPLNSWASCFMNGLITTDGSLYLVYKGLLVTKGSPIGKQSLAFEQSLAFVGRGPSFIDILDRQFVQVVSYLYRGPPICVEDLSSERIVFSL